MNKKDLLKMENKNKETNNEWKELGDAFLEYVEEYYPESYWKH